MQLVICVSLIISTIVGSSRLQAATSLFQERRAGQERPAEMADNISGEWSVTLFVGKQTAPATFIFKVDGEKVTGAVYSAHTGAGTIREGSWVKGKLVATLEFSSHESVVINATLRGDKLVGDFRSEDMVVKFEGTVNKQETPTGPSPMLWDKRLYDGGTMMLLLSAEKMPEEFYSFKPTDALLSFGQALGDVADWQYKNCSVVLAETNPKTKIDVSKASKADLIAALKDAFAYCGKAYAGMTEASAVQSVTFSSLAGPMLMPRRSVLDINTGLNSLHYGNLMIYMRLKNVVPPSSDPEILKKGPESLKSGQKKN